MLCLVLHEKMDSERKNEEKIVKEKFFRMFFYMFPIQ